MKWNWLYNKTVFRFLVFFVLAAALLPGNAVKAVEVQKISVELLLPEQVTDFPGVDKTVRAKVTNVSDTAIPDIMAYITMANFSKHMTVNLEDYSADKPVVVGDLQARESREVELPIRFVYTGRYLLYVTAVSSQSYGIQSSSAIPIDIQSNSSMDPAAVQTVVFGMPALLFGLIAAIWVIRLRKRRKVMADMRS